jgi:UDP-N-acetylmuramoylalanine--D-glutamate ligase
VWQSFGLDCNGYGRCELDGRHWLTLHGEPLAVDEMKIVGAHNQPTRWRPWPVRCGRHPREPQLAVLRRSKGCLTVPASCGR